jgi:MoaA/NifB/PqqE/SkfB family radical SAM enzyme
MPSRAFVRFLEGTARAEAGGDLMENLGRLRRTAPLSTYLAVTERCPYKCAHCSARFGKQGQDLSTDQWIEIIRALQELGTAYIGITGGEPLLRDDLEQMLAAIDERSTTILFTNGRDLSRTRAKSLKENGLFVLAVSLDSAREEKHNAIRGHPNAFQKALAAVTHAREAGLYTVVQSVVPKDELSREHLFRLFRLVRSRGAHEIRLHQPAPAGNLLDCDADDTTLFTEQDRQKLFAIQFEANRKFFGLPKVSSFPYTEGPDKFGCCAGVLHSYVTARGELTPCDFLPLSFGSVLEEDIGDLYCRMRDAMGGAHLGCLSLQIDKYLRDQELPVRGEAAVRICQSVASNSYPRFFQEIQNLG